MLVQKNDTCGTKYEIILSQVLFIIDYFAYLHSQ